MLNRRHLFIQEKKEFEQKFSKEQAALREQLQVRQRLCYSNITRLLLCSGLLTTHSLHPGSHTSVFLQENWESQSARLYWTARALSLYCIFLLWHHRCCIYKQRSFVLSWFSFPKGSYSDYWNSSLWEVGVADSPWTYSTSRAAEIR